MNNHSEIHISKSNIGKGLTVSSLRGIENAVSNRVNGQIKAIDEVSESENRQVTGTISESTHIFGDFSAY